MSPASVVCPEEELISPCICDTGELAEEEDEVNCSGASVTQSSLDNLFHQLRVLNSISSNQWLELSTVTITRTQLSQLNFTSLMRLRAQSFDINDNVNLEKILGPSLENGDEGKFIDVEKLEIHGNSLTDEGFREVLKYFTNQGCA